MKVSHNPWKLTTARIDIDSTLAAIENLKVGGARTADGGLGDESALIMRGLVTEDLT